MTIESCDLTTTQEFTIDLAGAGDCYRRKTRPANRRRQRVTRFIGREGDVETFTVQQTFPVVGSLNFDLPSDGQREAVEQFFGHCPESRWQAHIMLSARDYGLEVSSRYPFTAIRRMVIGVSVAAYILSDRGLRDDVRRWCENRYQEQSPGISSGIANHRPYRMASRFVEKLVMDMRGAGSEVFG